MKQIVHVKPHPKDQGNTLLYADGSTAVEVDGQIISTQSATPATVQWADSFSSENQNLRERYMAQAMAWASTFNTTA